MCLIVLPAKHAEGRIFGSGETDTISAGRAGMTAQTSSYKLLLVVIGIICVAVFPAGAETIILAHGDPLIYHGTNMPAYVTYDTRYVEAELLKNETLQKIQERVGTGRIWLFGRSDNIYGREFTGYPTNYSFTINSSDIWHMEPGRYNFVLQFPGPNDQFDIYYYNNNSRGIEYQELRTIYSGIKAESVRGLQPAFVYDKMMDLSYKDEIDDVFIGMTLDLQEPTIRLKTAYTKENGDLYIAGETNLAKNDTLVGIIDEEKYTTPEYRKMFSYTTYVKGDSLTENRTFEMVFRKDLAPQLEAGKTHIIYVHFLEDGVSTIPFRKYHELVYPTVTPEIRSYYSITGELIGYEINTTRPAATPTPVISVEPTKEYDTRIATVRDGNRDVSQHSEVYIGEKNLNIEPALGWYDDYGFYWIRYCDDPKDAAIKVVNPNHFTVDEETFSQKEGDWCQYLPGLEERVPPVAFTVKRNRFVTINTSFRIGSTVYDNPVNATPTEIQTVETTYPIVEPTIEITMVPIQTSEYPDGAVVVPVPWYLGVVAIALVVLWKRR